MSPFAFLYKNLSGHIFSKQKFPREIIYANRNYKTLQLYLLSSCICIGTHCTSETINRSLRNLLSYGSKNLNSVSRTIYNFWRKAATSVKHKKILEILFVFENMSADELTINLCTTLEWLGSLGINSNEISIVIIIQLWQRAFATVPRSSKKYCRCP